MSIGVQVSFDAADPQRLAEFWAVALDYVEQPPPDGFTTWDEFAVAMQIPEEDWDKLRAIVDPDGAGPRLLFQKVPEGKTAKNRVHLDVNVGKPAADPESRRRLVDAHVARLVEAGAIHTATFDTEHEYWVVMADPEGNEFCVQ